MNICLEDVTYNCGLFNSILEHWRDYFCTSTGANPHHCACQKDVPVYLKLRGLCEETNIDTYWMPITEEGKYYLLGTSWSIIQFNASKRGWDLEVLDREESTVGFSKLSFHSFVLGKSNWLIENDCKNESV